MASTSLLEWWSEAHTTSSADADVVYQGLAAALHSSSPDETSDSESWNLLAAAAVGHAIGAAKPQLSPVQLDHIFPPGVDWRARLRAVTQAQPPAGPHRFGVGARTSTPRVIGNLPCLDLQLVGRCSELQKVVGSLRHSKPKLLAQAHSHRAAADLSAKLSQLQSLHQEAAERGEEAAAQLLADVAASLQDVCTGGQGPAGTVQVPAVQAVCLVGRPGVGKSVLALTAAQQLLQDATGGWHAGFYADLQGIRDVQSACIVLLTAVGLVYHGLGSPSQLLRAWLMSNRALRIGLLVDNADQLPKEPFSKLLAKLLKASPRLQILLTSQQAILQQSASVTIAGLQQDEALALCPAAAALPAGSIVAAAMVPAALVVLNSLSRTSAAGLEAAGAAMGTAGDSCLLNRSVELLLASLPGDLAYAAYALSHLTGPFTAAAAVELLGTASNSSAVSGTDLPSSSRAARRILAALADMGLLLRFQPDSHLFAMPQSLHGAFRSMTVHPSPLSNASESVTAALSRMCTVQLSKAAALYYTQGSADAAVRMLMKALPWLSATISTVSSPSSGNAAQQQLLGLVHAIWRCRSVLADMLAWDASKAIVDALLKLCSLSSSAEHVALVGSSYAEFLRHAGRLSEAQSASDASTKALQMAVGKEHDTLLWHLLTRCHVLLDLGTDESLAEAADTIRMLVEKRSRAHESDANYLHVLALQLQAVVAWKQRSDDAVVLLAQSAAASLTCFGGVHPCAMKTFEAAAEALLHNEDAGKAHQLSTQYLQALRCRLGNEHLLVGRQLVGHGKALFQLERLQEAHASTMEGVLELSGWPGISSSETHMDGLFLLMDILLQVEAYDKTHAVIATAGQLDVGKNPALTVRRLVYLAKVHEVHNRDSEAEATYSQALATWSASDGASRAAQEAAVGLVRVRVRSSQFQQAELDVQLHLPQLLQTASQVQSKRAQNAGLVTRSDADTEALAAELLLQCALLLQLQGKYASGREAAHDALRLLQQCNAEGSLHWQALYQLATLEIDLGNATEAQRLLSQCASHAGVTHVMLAKVMLAEGRCLWALGDLPAAKSKMYAAVMALESSVGALHPGVADLLDDLAHFFGAIGKHSKSEKLLERSIQIREKTLGQNHAKVAGSLEMLSKVLCKLQRHAEAFTALGRSLSILSSSNPLNTMLLAEAQVQLGGLALQMNRLEEARGFFSAALMAYQACLGERHHSTATVGVQLAAVMCKQNDPDAEAVCHAHLDVLQAALGAADLAVAEATITLSAAMVHRKALREAHALAYTALKTLKKAYNFRHPSVARALLQVADLSMRCRNEQDAEKRLREALAVHNNMNLQDFTGAAEAMLALAKCLLSQRKGLDEAEGLLRGACELVQKGPARDSPLHASTLCELAQYLLRRNTKATLKEAEALQWRAVEVLDKATQRIPRTVASAQSQKRHMTSRAHMLLQLAELLAASSCHSQPAQQANRKLSTAKRTSVEALSLMEQATGSSSMDVADALCVVGRLAALEPDPDLEAADNSFQRAVDIRASTLGPEHPELPKCLHDTACVLMQAGRLENARELMQRALGMQERAVGRDNPWLLPVLASLQQCCQLQDDHASCDELQVRIEALQHAQTPAVPGDASSLFQPEWSLVAKGMAESL